MILMIFGIISIIIVAIGCKVLQDLTLVFEPYIHNNPACLRDTS